MTNDITIPSEVPWGMMVLYGRKAAGKTIAALNSPWGPVHIIDTEESSSDYEKHMDRVIKEGVLKGPFTRANCPTYDRFRKEADRILKGSERYGTLIIDTAGQLTTWVGEEEFLKAGEEKARTMSQVVWGKVRDRLRDLALRLSAKTSLLILTAHEREYNKAKSSRMNPALIEVCALSIRLERQPNSKLPSAIVDGSRLPFLPPRIPNFEIVKLLPYFVRSADWDNLKEEEKQQADPVPVQGGMPDFEAMELSD